MPVKKGGKKQKKKKTVSSEVERQLEFKDENQEYGQILKLLGSCRAEIRCFDGKIRLAHIRGSMRKKIWIVVNDVVLVSLRDFEDSKADIILKYSQKEISRLKEMGEIPNNVVTTDTLAEDKEIEDLGFDFGDSDVEIDEKETKKKLRDLDIDAI